MIEAPWQERTAESVELYQQAKYRDSEVGFTEALSLARQSGTPIEVAEALYNLSTAYFALSKFKDTEKVLEEALLLATGEDKDAVSLRACLLNSRARLLAESEEFVQVEKDLLEAMKLAEPIHPVYAAEIAGNLTRLYASTPEWFDRIKSASDDFERLHGLNEPLEVYFDDLAGWRRPGKSWDRPGCTSPECIEARIISNRSSWRHRSKFDRKADYEAVLQLDEETRAVPPHMVVYAHMMLAEIAFHSADPLGANTHSQDALRASEISYLRNHPGNYNAYLMAATYSIMSTTPEKSRTWFEVAENMVREALGENNPHYVRCLTGKAFVLPWLPGKGADTVKEQERNVLKCLEICREFYAENNTKMLLLQILLSDIYINNNRLQEAETLLEKIREYARTNFHADDMECKALKSLADLRLKQNRPNDAKEYLLRQETLLAEQTYNEDDTKLPFLDSIGQKLLAAGFPQEAERVYRKALAMAPPRRADLIRRTSLELALCLMRLGKTDEANQLLGKSSDKKDADSPPATKREELVEQSRRAWSFQISKRYEEAKELATRVVKEAHVLMPECEESLILALSVLLEQATLEGKPDEIQRLTGILTGYKGSIRLQCVVPTFYLEAAKAYAKQRSIKADALFEQALQAAESIHSIVPHVLDSCYFEYMNHNTNTNKIEKALLLCEKLLELRATASGTQSQPYASLLSTKAILLLDTDPSGADWNSKESLKILDELGAEESKETFIALSVRSIILKKLLRFEEIPELEKRMEDFKTKLKERAQAAAAAAASSVGEKKE